MRKNFELLTNLNKIKPLGRYQILSDGIGCDHCATGIELCVEGIGEVTLSLYTTVEKEHCDSAYFTVYLDGKRIQKRLEAPAGEHTVTVVDFSEKGKHTLKIVKQAESNYNLCTLRSVSLDGELLAPPSENGKYIEYIGDSLSCGMGILGKKGVPEPQTSLWEDVTLAYTYCSAEQLFADCSIISESGIGLAGSWFDPLFDFYTSWSYKRNKNLKYDFARVPDLIVINLGTNDFYLNCDLNICPIDEVIEKTKEFILLVRNAYKKDIPIVWVGRFMAMGESYINALDTAIEALGGLGAQIYRLDVPTSSGGAHGHPDIAGHAAACGMLVDFIKKNNLI